MPDEGHNKPLVAAMLWGIGPVPFFCSILMPIEDNTISSLQARVDKQIRVMRVALANVTVVLLMWLPITVVLCLIYVDGDRPLHDTSFFLR